MTLPSFSRRTVVSFCILALSTGVVFAASRFVDDATFASWYSPAIERMQTLGIMQGYPDGTFQPDRTVSRAELAVAMSGMVDLFSKPSTPQANAPAASIDTSMLERTLRVQHDVAAAAVSPDIQVMTIMAEVGVKRLPLPPDAPGDRVTSINGETVKLLPGYTLYNYNSIVSVSYLHFAGTRFEGDVAHDEDAWYGPFYQYLPLTGVK